MSDERSSVERKRSEQSPAEHTPAQGEGITTPPGETKRTENGKSHARKKRTGKRIERLFADIERDLVDPGATPPDAIPEPSPEIPIDGTPKEEPIAVQPSEDTRADLHLPDTGLDEELHAPSPTQREDSLIPAPELFTREGRPPEAIPPESDLSEATPDEQIPPESPPATEPSGQFDVHTAPLPFTGAKTLGVQSTSLHKPDGDGKGVKEEDQILPADKMLTPIGWESLRLKQPVAKNAEEDQPAMLAYARPVGGLVTDEPPSDESQLDSAQSRAAQSLLLEILDEDPRRAWSEDELLLVEQVTDQLSLALENARLHQETRRQLTEQTALRQASAVLFSALDTETILAHLIEQMCLALHATSAYINSYDPETFTSTVLAEYFSPSANARERQSDLGQSYTDPDEEFYKSLEAGEHHIAHIDDEDLTQFEREHMHHYEVKSVLYIPLKIQEQITGFVELWESRYKREFTPEEINLCHDISRQASVAIERTQLFEQTQNALGALEVSERYQKSVARAVATLTERGIAALSDVLQILGEAVQASRAYYIETQADHRGAYWRLIAEWCAEGVPSQLDNPTLRRLSTKWVSPWLERLRADGHVSLETMTGTPEIQEFFESLGTRSTLQFAVAGRHEIPGCIGFEQIDYDRAWTSDEISALQTAASALANTIAREDLFTQVQINLAETEALYRASARLNSAVGYEEILNVLCQHTILGHTNASSVALYLFDRPWTRNDKPEWLIPVAVRSAEPIEEGTPERYPLSNWTNAESLLDPEHPTVLTDALNDPRASGTAEDSFIQQLEAKSQVFIPLNVSGRWIGHIIAAYRQITGFPEQEIRRLTSLTGQAAVVIESLRLLDETRQRAEELATINQITSAASRTLELSEVLTEILSRLLGTFEYQAGLISIADPITHRLYLATHKNLPERMINRLLEKGLDDTPCDLVYQLGQTMHIADLNELPEEIASWERIFEGPKSIGFRSYLGTPLVSKGTKLGTVCIFNPTPQTISPSRLSLMEAIGQQVGVVVDNARLFESTQTALSETEALLQASAEMSAVQTYDEILQTLRKYTILGQADRIVHISLFDRPWTGESDEDMPQWVTPIAHWTTLPPEKLRWRYALADYPATKLFSPTEAIFIEDISNDSRLDEKLRRLYSEIFQGQSTVFVPLFVGGLRIGFINGVYALPTRFDDQEMRRLLALAGQAAVAVQNLNSIQLAEQRALEAHRRSEELALINSVVSVVAASLDPQSSLDIITTELADALNAFASIALLNQERRVLTVVTNYSPFPDAPNTLGLEIPLEGNASWQQVIETRRFLLIDDPQHDARTNPMHEVMRQLDVRTLLIIPIIAGNEVIGAVNLEVLQEERAFKPEEIRLAEAIVLQASTAIQNARLFEEIQRRANQLQTAAEIARDASSTLALDALLQGSINLLCERFGYYQASIFLLDDKGKFAVVHGATGSAGEEMKRTGHKLIVGGQSVIGQVTALGQPIVLNDINQEEAKAIFSPNPLLPLTRAELGIPLKVGDRVIGALDVQSSTTNAFSDDDVSVLRTLSDQIAVAVDNARSYELAQKAVEEIREADRLKSQFLANMSHELRTPLNSIIGFSRVILKGIDGPVNELQQQDLTAIYNSGQHLLGLINDVLDLSKIEAGKMELAFEENVNLADIIKGVMSTTVGLVKDKPIKLYQAIDPELPLLRIDPMKIRQVLLNLLANAAKFTEEGSITVEARTQTRPDAEPEVIVLVTDSGSGIAPEDQAKLFQPFSQVDGSLTRKTGGSGLGLSICQHMIRLHGGRIGLKSQAGKGSTFYFTLPTRTPEPLSQFGTGNLQLPVPTESDLMSPIKPESSARQALPPETLEDQSGEPIQDRKPAQSPESLNELGPMAILPPDEVRDTETRPRLILAIDKDPQVVDLYKRYLTDHPYTVETLTELKQAVKVARSLQPFAITLDVTMQSSSDLESGGLDGWQVLEALKIDPDTRNIPVIVCTIITEQERAFRLGAIDYLLKPILKEELAQAIDRLKA